MTTQQRQYIEACAQRYRSDLLNDILPFWFDHGLDSVNGGVYTCLDRRGELMDSTKSVWFQGRFGYICSLAYNAVERNPRFLEAARSCIDFIERHCFDSDGHMFFTVTAEGHPVQKRRYVFSECFAAIAMAEYAKASGLQEYAEKALSLYKNTLRMLAEPDFLPPKTTVKAIGHSITMMLINVATVLKQVADDPLLDEQTDKSLDIIEHRLMNHRYKSVLEMVAPDGSLIDTCAGRTINPGHCIETAWFIMEAARGRNDKKHLDEMALTIFDWAWEWGWDEEFGGVINFRDCRNFPPQDYSQDMKFWWPQCETIIASLYAYAVSGDGKYLDIHRKAHEWAYAHLKDEECGEWYGYLHRDGTVAQPAKGNIFKGPFHIPRMMIRAALLCDEILKSQDR